MINSHILAEFLFLEIGLRYYLTKKSTVSVTFVQTLTMVGVAFTFYLQNKFPPYESRITTAKLLIESEEYEVKCGVNFK